MQTKSREADGLIAGLFYVKQTRKKRGLAVLLSAFPYFSESLNRLRPGPRLHRKNGYGNSYLIYNLFIFYSNLILGCTVKMGTLHRKNGYGRTVKMGTVHRRFGYAFGALVLLYI